MKRSVSRLGKVMLGILLFFVAVLVVSIPVGIVGSSNLVWGEDYQYGRVALPGTGQITLPAGTAIVNVALFIPGRGNGTPDMPFPSDLSIALTPVGSAGQPVIHEVDDSTSSNANDDRDNTQREAWTIDVPRAGTYQVTAKGTFTGLGVNAQVWFGHEPPIPGVYVPLVAAAIVVVGGLLWLLLRQLRRRGKPADTVDTPPAATLSSHPDSHAPVDRSEPSARRPSQAPAANPVDRSRRHPRTSGADSVDRLAKLADLHDRGALTDAEFAAEKAKIIGS